jgi:tRNA (cytidine/uridine-2'-O-)-methyltransferase
LINIVLLNPKIPQNTGAIGRTCVAIGAALHIIGPIPFEITDAKLRRAGMDYWFDLDFTYWSSFEDFANKITIDETHYFLTTKSKRNFFDAKFSKNAYIWFGAEDAGLPEELIFSNLEKCFRIPMKEGYRSLNVANAASLVAYEALRQNRLEFEWIE